MNLSQAQQKACSHYKGPCLVLAVPGAGKTTVLLHRLENLIKLGVRPENIASLTFSNMQARDMKNRFVRKHPDSYAMTFSTIHAFCYKIILKYAKKHGQKIGLIEGSSEWNKYKILSGLFYNIKKRPITDDEFESFFRIDGFLKNSLMTYDQYKSKIDRPFHKFEELSARYQNFKAERNLIDFDDMLIMALGIFDKDPDMLEKIRARFRFYQIDEAQDTSPIQFKIIEKLAAPNNNLFMVADDDQTIYGFRGADPSYLLRFKELYPQAEIISMEDNYRSSKNIVNLAANFIQINESRYNKKPTPVKSDNEKIRLFTLSNLNEELVLLKNEIPKDLGNGDCAVLFRNNLSLIGPANLFFEMGIPFSISANDKRFFNNPVFIDLMDILFFARHPDDLETFKKIYYKFNSYIKKSFIQALELTDPMEAVLDRLLDLGACQNSFYREKIGYLQYEFDRIAKLGAKKALDEIDKFSGYGTYLKEKEKVNANSGGGGPRVMETMKVLARPDMSIDEFLSHVDKLKRVFYDKATGSESLHLSTIHGSKGLEYDTVWLIDLIQGEFPSNGAIQADNPYGDILLEEERRLFYVGMTRAKSGLRLVGVENINGINYGYSQFLDEIKKKGRK